MPPVFFDTYSCEIVFREFSRSLTEYPSLQHTIGDFLLCNDDMSAGCLYSSHQVLVMFAGNGASVAFVPGVQWFSTSCTMRN
ncbi:MAG: hypothetical protein U5N86_13455 [Planctomycetota bacterium]|nr:hypothetical protein [Planctomycetota bacterium]